MAARLWWFLLPARPVKVYHVVMGLSHSMFHCLFSCSHLRQFNDRLLLDIIPWRHNLSGRDWVTRTGCREGNQRGVGSIGGGVGKWTLLSYYVVVIGFGSEFNCLLSLHLNFQRYSFLWLDKFLLHNLCLFFEWWQPIMIKYLLHLILESRVLWDVAVHESLRWTIYWFWGKSLVSFADESCAALLDIF